MQIKALDKPSDFDEIVFFISQLFTELMGPEAVPGEAMVEHIRQQWLSDSAGHWAFQALNEAGEVLAFVTLAEAFSIFAHGKYGIINELWVSPNHRSHGVGAEMLKFCKQFAARQGWERLDVTAPPGDEWQRSVEFYRQNGFEFTGKKLKCINFNGEKKCRKRQPINQN